MKTLVAKGFALYCLLVLVPAVVWSADTSGVSAQSISLPSGPGSIEGLGESFEPQLNTGTATYAVNFAVPPGRQGLQPSLGIAYNGGSGNGPVGMGWSITGLDFIQRQTDKGLPAYDPSDIFVSGAGEELVPLDDGSFRAENEGGFKRYFFNAGTNTWRAELPDGGELTFGAAASARIEDTGRTYRWMLTRIEDSVGNRADYVYTSLSGSVNQVFLSRIYYTRHSEQSLNGEHVVVLTYAGNRPDPISDFRPSYELTTTHRLARIDMCTRGGTFPPESLCDGVGEVGAARVRSYRLRYDEVGACESLTCSRGLVGSFCSDDDQCVAGATRLAGVQQVGADDASTLPELTFGYTDYNFSTTASWSGVFGFPSTELAGSESALADLDADGLPDVVQTPAADPGVYKRWMNLGPAANGAVQFASEDSFTGPTSQRIGNPGTQLVDLDGDGVADLLTRPDPTGDTFELFRGTGKGFFELTAEPFQILGVDGFTSSGEGFGSGAVRFVDVDFDKRIDVVRTVALGSAADDLLVRQTADIGTGRGMLPTRSCGAVPDALFQDGKTFLEDLNGDRLLDIVVVEIAGGGDAVEEIRYYPNVGTGGFGRLGSCGQQGLPIVVGGDPVASLPGADFSSFRRFFWHDLTNDGLGDLVYLGPTSVSVWVNRGGSGLFRVDLGAYPDSAELTLCDPGPGCTPDVVQFTDMNGNSTTDVLFGDVETGVVLYLDLAGPLGVPAHLLETIDNGLGRNTTIGYEPSTTDYLAAVAAGTPWKSRLPFPVTVVASRSVRFGLDLDGVPGEDVYEADYRYRDGFYDGVEKEFRGFSEVQAITRGDIAQPTLVTRHSFHTGAPDGIDNDNDGDIDERTVRGGAEEESLKGVTLEVRAETCSNGPGGDCAVTGETFDHNFSRWEVKTLYGATGKACSDDPIVACCSDTDCSDNGLGTCEVQAAAEVGSQPEAACEVGKSVHWAVTTGQRQAIIERGSGPRIDIMSEMEFDDFGNTIVQKRWGIVDAATPPPFGCHLTSGVCDNDAFIVCGTDTDCGQQGSCLKSSHADALECTNADPFAFSNSASLVDERFETTQYIINEQDWQLRCASESSVSDVNGSEESRARTFYDELTLGECTEGLPSRTEGWLDEEGRWIVQDASSYDDFGNRVEARDALQNLRSFSLDENFATFPVSETIDLGQYSISITAGHHEGFGLVTSATQWDALADGPRSDFGYDTHARIITRVLPGDSAQAPTTSYSYHLNPGNDGVSWIDTHARETTGGGSVDSRQYLDSMGHQLATLSEGDDDNWVVDQLKGYGLAGTRRADWVPFFTDSLALPDLDPALPHRETRRDEKGRELEQTLPGGDSLANLYRPLAADRSDENDTAGVTPGAVTTTTTDGLDRLASVVERDNGSPHTTRYAYDATGGLIERSDALGNQTHIVYDHLGRRLRYEGPDRGTLSYSYDDADRIIESLDARGARVIRTFDAVGRVLTETEVLPGDSPGGPAVTYHYDEGTAGPVDWGDGRSGLQTRLDAQISWIEDPTGEEYYSYDDRGRLVFVTKQLKRLSTGASAAYTLHHQYDAMNRLTDLEYPDGDRLNFSYGPGGLLQRVAGGTGSGQVLVESASYGADGKLLELVFGSGVRELVQYDDRQRRETARVETAGGVRYIDRQVEYDPASNPTALLDLRDDFAPGTPRHNTRRMEYDDLHRLTSFRLGSVDAPSLDAGRAEFSYDSIGNRLSRSSSIAGDPAFSAGVPVAYAYGGSAGRTGRGPRVPSDPAGPHALTSVGGDSFTYDDSGNLTAYEDVLANWDPLDRLVRLASPSYETDYAYDHAGRRVSKRVRWLQASARHHAGEESESLYPHRDFELRNGDPVKVVYFGDRRLAEVTGTLDPTAERVQRLPLRSGWNLVSIVVDAADAAAQLKLGSGLNEHSAWLWSRVRREYSAVESGTPLPSGSVLWIDAAQPVDLQLRGSHSASSNPMVEAGGGFVALASLASLPASALANSSEIFGFDALEQTWKVRSGGDFPLDELPAQLPPGAALYSSQFVSGVGTAPPEGARTRFFHTDLTKSTSVVTDAAGQLVEESTYLPFGGIRVRTTGADAGLERSAYDFSSKERDEESGLSHVEARYLDTALARFISVDSALLEIGAPTEPRRLNGYAYALNNPFRFSDPDGREAVFSRFRQATRRRISAEMQRQAARDFVPRTAKMIMNKLYTTRQQLVIKRTAAASSQARAALNKQQAEAATASRKHRDLSSRISLKLDELQGARKQAERAKQAYNSFVKKTEGVSSDARNAHAELFHDEAHGKLREVHKLQDQFSDLAGDTQKESINSSAIEHIARLERQETADEAEYAFGEAVLGPLIDQAKDYFVDDTNGAFRNAFDDD